jgi:hypothetical protein
VATQLQTIAPPPTANRLDVPSTLRLATPDSTLLERNKGTLAGYCRDTVQAIKQKLALATIQKKTTEQVIDELTRPGGILDGERYRARRIVQTEMAHLYNKRIHEQIEARAANNPNVRKRLVNIIDSRTAPDTYAIIAYPNNLVRPVKEPFYDPTTGREFLYPPNRPNDRATIAIFFATPPEQQAVQQETQRAEEKAKELKLETHDGRPVSKPDPEPQPVFGPGVRPAVLYIADGPLATGEGIKFYKGVAEQTGFGAVLARQPLRHLVFEEWSPGQWLGSYDPEIDRITIAKGRPFGQPLRWGSIWSLSVAEKTETLAREATLIHELAHKFFFRRKSTSALFDSVYERSVKFKMLPSKRAEHEKDEFIPELVVAYYRHRNLLLQLNDEGYLLIQKVLRDLGAKTHDDV